MSQELRLKSVYSWESSAGARVLYDLLEERDSTINISHGAMPTWERHVQFVNSKPYQFWYFIVKSDEKGQILGAIYLTKSDEIGIFIFKKWQGNGYGPKAIKLLMEQCGPRRYIAHINPENSRSTMVFHKLGFKWKQSTYTLET